MAKVFISYSRKDLEFAKRLTGELQKSELDFWIDWEGIPPTVDWWKEIEKGIEEADIFLFLVSPDSSASKICEQEIDTAVKNGKRLIPVVVRDVKAEEAPLQLRHLNWIFFRENDVFDTSLKKLITAIHTDYAWVQTHRRLQVKALEWERKHKENSFLLRGKDLQEAELQLATNTSKEPHPTDLQREYVFKSRQFADKERNNARLRLSVFSSVGLGLVLMIGLAVAGKLNHFIYRPVDMENYWISIPAGKFQMGSSENEINYIKNLCPDCIWPNDRTQHEVYLDEYQIGKYEVTNRQYNLCVKAGICSAPADKIYTNPSYQFHPVTNVDWYDAKTYCEWVGGRLPTEAEWEKAASWDDNAKKKNIYPWGDKVDCSLANYDFSCVGDTMPVGSYESGKSPYGLYDMLGNVYEWVNDWYSDVYYNQSPASNPKGPENGEERVLRGGSWFGFNNASSSIRNKIKPTSFDPYGGFRCARNTPTGNTP